MSFDRGLHVFSSPAFRGVVKDAIEFFAHTPSYEMPLQDRFTGAGVYGLYYLGDFEPYEKIARLNQPTCRQPIYIGKAVPKGWRTGRIAGASSDDLFKRLKEHANSIIQANSTLSVTDFRCHFMILQEIESDLIAPVEAELIRIYQPLWNCVVAGFGIHHPGSGRYDQSPSEWDTLHRGRYFAERLLGEKRSLDEIIEKIRAYIPPLFQKQPEDLNL